MSPVCTALPHFSQGFGPQGTRKIVTDLSLVDATIHSVFVDPQDGKSVTNNGKSSHGKLCIY